MKGIFELEAFHEPEGNNLLLVDSLNLAFRYKHKRQRDFGVDYLRTVQSLAKSYNCGTTIITGDMGSSDYRKKIYPEYKGNRKEKYKDQSDEDKQAFKEFLEDYEETIELLQRRFPTLRFRGVEADDIMSVVCTNAYDKFDKIWIVSTDRDMDQLVNDKVNRFCYYTRKEVRLDNFADKYNCTPEEYISLKVLQGDSGDNVPGVPLVGAKRGAALIRQYGSAFDIYDNIPLEGKAKYIQNLNNFKDQLLVNYRLMDLSFSAEAVGEYLNEILEVLNEKG